MKKIIFPFYNGEKHSFLFKKWQFRLSIILYIIILLAIGLSIFADYINAFTSCYDFVIKTYEYGSRLYQSEFANCKIGVYENLLPAIGSGLLSIVLTHYVIQIFFFKIIVGYVILGNKK